MRSGGWWLSRSTISIEAVCIGYELLGRCTCDILAIDSLEVTEVGSTEPIRIRRSPARAAATALTWQSGKDSSILDISAAATAAEGWLVRHSSRLKQR